MRGKHGAQAAARRDANEAATTIESYQHAVKRLTAENDSLREQLAQSRREHTRDVRVLKANLAEGLSPEIAALRRTVEDLRSEVDRAKRDAQMTRGVMDRSFGRLCDHFRTAHGRTGLEAVEDAMALGLREGEGRITIVDPPNGRWPTERDRAIQVARGERST